MTKARLVENIGQLVNDANSALGHLETSRPFDPFNGIYLLIYQMTHRLLGSYDVANSPRLLAETLAVYDRMGDSSAMQTMFPMMPTLGMLRKLCGGARLHFLFRSIIRDRRKCGRRENDAMQIMMDNGDSDIQISTVSFVCAYDQGSVILTALGYHLQPFCRAPQQWCQRSMDTLLSCQSS